MGSCENDLNHPDRPRWIESYLRTEFHQNANLFSPAPVTFTYELELEGIKAKWLKGETAKTMRWYLNNMKKASDHPRLKLTLKGFDLFENPEKLEALDDNERVSLNLYAEMQGGEKLIKPVTCAFLNNNGETCYSITVNIPEKLDPQNQKDCHYIGMYALHYLAMKHREEKDDEITPTLNRITIDGHTVSIADTHSFAVTGDRGPDSSYPSIQGYRNKLSHYHPAFAR